MIRMKVKLLAYTPDPEKLVAAAAKNCYSSTDVDSVLDGLTEEKTESFVNMLSEIGHESPIEHVSFTFAIESVSRSLLAQITRHRIASFSVQSQRYVREKGFEYVVPPEIDKNSGCPGKIHSGDGGRPAHLRGTDGRADGRLPQGAARAGCSGEGCPQQG